ncbi:glycosyltransferase family 4 protein [Nitrogeniibacter mangrovi]|uniref:Glycosyltransferase family 4 protein n=1 Tax=Nitrogeniibacter mangrovi TaxID=2016596 RepID=A0A6C1B6Z2_9RHOO|nr:glycosyltransferase [Nitrogeniibacter mangrovi]QID18729.1 glycosyltransferase family 4 protein [Nitrogeniibacter mangrovi]
MTTEMPPSSPLTVCLVSDDAIPAMTGVGTHIQLIAREMVARGHRVVLVTTRRAGQPEIEDWEGVRIHRVPSVRVFGFYQGLPSKRRIRDILTEEGVDLVHHHYASLMMKRVLAVAARLGLPQVSTHHFSAEVLTQPLVMRPMRGIIRAQMVAYSNRCDVVIVPSSSLSERLRADGVTVPLRHISNPVGFGDPAAVSPAQRNGAFVVLYAGRLGPEKNIGLLLRAFRRLREAVPDARLWIAGRGPTGPSLEALAGELGIRDQVDFLGFLDPAMLATRYRSCDLFVLPSVEEAQPLVVLEAMWFSKPVIVTRAIAAAREMVEPGVTGQIVDPADPSDLAERMIAFAQDDTGRLQMGAAGRERAAHYTPAAIVGELLELYLDVCRQRGRPTGAASGVFE